MNADEALRSSWREIRANPVRSALSFAAISVGAASLLYTLAQTRGMREVLEREVALMGEASLTVSGKRNHVSKGLSKGLTAQDAEAIRSELPGLLMVSPTRDRWGVRLIDGGKPLEVNVTGVTPDWALRDWVYRLRGRFLNWDDQRRGARVCVIVEPGGWLEKPFWAKFWLGDAPDRFGELVRRRDMLGRRILLDERVFTVVGVLKEPPKDEDPRWSRWGSPQVLVPLSAFARYLAPAAPDVVEEIKIDAGRVEELPRARRRLEALLLRRHRGEDDVEIEDRRAELEDRLREQGEYVAAALALGLVAMLSGGIGILNVTLAAVFSRVKEIGVRRALGASRADVVALFLSEAALLGAAGGLAGVALGWAGIEWLAKGAGRDVAELAWHHAAAMTAVSALVAAAFAAVPAWRASRLDPVEALRSEP